MTNKIDQPLIHVARIKQAFCSMYLFLRKTSYNQYVWFKDLKEKEEETAIQASSIEEAIRMARREWERDIYFQTLGCGFRYTLPERDEHGSNALFYQMAASLSVSNGIYYEEELGHSCIVHNASEEAIRLWHRLRAEKRL